MLRNGGDPNSEVIEGMRHEEFAERAAERLEAEADRLDKEARGFAIDGEAATTAARAGGLRVAALLVREEAEAAGKAEEGRRPVSDAPPLEAQA